MYKILHINDLTADQTDDIKITGNCQYLDGSHLVYAGRIKGRNPAQITSNSETWFGAKGWLGNPYVMHNESERKEVIARFKVYFWNRVNADVPYRNSIMRLRGDTSFVCYCNPLPCHIQVIIDWLEAGCPLRTPQERMSNAMREARALFPIE